MTEKKNVILLTIDSLRGDHLGCLGYSKNVSPNIDKLAKEGVLFSQAIANGGNTVCSFPSIHTSSYAFMHCLSTSGNFPRDWIFLSEDSVTIAEVFKRNGYTTAAFHCNPWISSFFNYNRGFDQFDDSLGLNKKRKRRYRRKKGRDKTFPLFQKRKSRFEKESRPWGPWSNVKLISSNSLFGIHILIKKLLNKRRMWNLTYEDFQWSTHLLRADLLHQKALSLLENISNPFFLWLHYMDVHLPYLPSDSTFIEQIKAFRLWKNRNKPNLSPTDLKKLIELYDREIRYVDSEIGYFLNKLRKIGFSQDNTYIILTADHGEQLREHGKIGHGYLYDEIIRVPLVICGPDIKKNIVIENQVSLLDLGPTICDLVNMKKPKTFLGTSLYAVIRGEVSGKFRMKEVYSKYVISETISAVGRKFFSLRTKEWKYIFTFSKHYEKWRRELYNLRWDPKEQRNLIKDMEKQAKKFEIELLNHISVEEKQKLMRKERNRIREKIKNLKAKGFI